MAQKATTASKLDQLTDAQERNKAAGGAFIGCIIGWKISNNARIKRDTLLQAANSYGVPSSYLPKEVKPAKAFRKAIEKTRGSAKDNGLLLRYIGSSPSDEDQKIVVGLVEETADLKTENLEYAQKGVINYCAGNITENISSNYPEIAEELFDYFEFFSEHTADDIRRILIAFTSKCAARLTPSGGSYFVPSTNNSILNSVDKFFNELCQNTDSKIFTFEIYDSPQNQSDLSTVAQDNLESEIQELANDLSSFLAEAKRASSKFEAGLNHRAEQATELKNRVHAFGSVLKFQSNLLYDKLNQIEQAITQKHIDRQILKDRVAAMSSGDSEESKATVSLLIDSTDLDF